MRAMALFLATLSLVFSLACAAKKEMSSERQGRIVSVVTTPLAAGESCRMTGQVVDDMGEPIIGASITLTCPEEKGSLGAATDVTGHFSFPRITCPDTCVMTIDAAGYTSLRDSISVPTSCQMQLTVRLGGSVIDILRSSEDPPIINNRSTTTGALIIIDPKSGEARPEPL